MKCLVVQFQPDASSRDLPEATVARAMQDIAWTADAGLDVARGVDEGTYVNDAFTASDLGRVWRPLRRALSGTAAFEVALADSVIVTCEGGHGWGDYRLLHHFDRTEPTEDDPG